MIMMGRNTAQAVREAEAEAYGSADDNGPTPEGAPGVAAPEERAEADDLDELGDEIARMAANLHAYKHGYLVRVAEFDRRSGWEPGGHRNCAYWLSFRTGFDLNTCYQHVRVARALETLPVISGAMARGRLSFSQVRALVRAATPEHEAELVELAEGVPTAQLVKMLRGFRKGTRQDECDRERERHRMRRLAIFSDDEGMVVVAGRLMPETGELLMKALEAAEDALFKRDGRHDPRASERKRRREARRRRADAAGLVAERALAAGFEGKDAPVSGSRAERYQVMLHVDRTTLTTDTPEEGAPEERESLTDGQRPQEEAAREGAAAPNQVVGHDQPGRSRLGVTGTRVSADTSRRLTCDCAVVEIQRGSGGEVLDVGRRRRTVPPAIRRALEVRDRGCRFPGCGLRFTDGHHVVHWADGGHTSLENCALLCSLHHRLVHEGGWQMEWCGKGYAVFMDPRGGIHTEEPPETPELEEEPARAVIRENRRRGAVPGPRDASARWKRERDVPDDVYFAALEAGFAAVDGGAGEGPDYDEIDAASPAPP